MYAMTAAAARHAAHVSTPSSPAGASSSVSDMARWLSCCWRRGAQQGQQLVALQSPGRPRRQEGHYGFGFNVAATDGGLKFLQPFRARLHAGRGHLLHAHSSWTLPSSLTPPAAFHQRSRRQPVPASSWIRNRPPITRTGGRCTKDRSADGARRDPCWASSPVSPQSLRARCSAMPEAMTACHGGAGQPRRQPAAADMSPQTRCVLALERQPVLLRS